MSEQLTIAEKLAAQEARIAKLEAQVERLTKLVNALTLVVTTPKESP